MQDIVWSFEQSDRTNFNSDTGLFIVDIANVNTIIIYNNAKITFIPSFPTPIPIPAGYFIIGGKDGIFLQPGMKKIINGNKNEICISKLQVELLGITGTQSLLLIKKRYL